MVRSSLFRASLVANAVLFALVGWFGSRAMNTAPGAQAGGSADPEGQAAASLGRPGAAIAPPTAALDWRRLESPDFAAYAANLRAIGCPEVTLCDIIRPALARVYGEQKRAIPGAERGPFHFWETAERSDAKPPVSPEVEARMKALDDQMHALLVQILGDDCGDNRPAPDHDDWGRRLGFLSEARRREIQAVLNRHPGIDDQIRSLVDLGTGRMDAAYAGKLLASYHEKQDELRQLMSPDEFEQYEMSTSWTAGNLRTALMGFNPTEDEFREIFRVWRAQDEHLADVYAAGALDPGTTDVQRALNEVLGEERYQQYSRTWRNPDLQSLAQMAEEFSLTPDTPLQVDSLKQAYMAQIAQLNADPSLPPDQRAASLETLRQETSAQVERALGGEAFGRYAATRGVWLQAPSPQPSP